MKKLLQFVTGLTLLVFMMPWITVGFHANAGEANTETSKNAIGKSPFAETVAESPLVIRQSYDTDQKVTVYAEGNVEEMSMRSYLEGVLAAEMPASFPEEALRAQAIAARTYALYKIALFEKQNTSDVHHGAQLCADSQHCEAYWDLEEKADTIWGESAELYRERIQAAVKETDGMVLTYQEEPIAAVFCAASGEKTESAKDIWGSEIPYLVSVDSPGGQDCAKYRSEVRINQRDFAEKIRKEAPAADFSMPPDQWFQDVTRSEAGGVISAKIGGTQLSGTKIRKLANLNSANFTVRIDGDDLVFETVGYGHGVGLSQYGARYLALAGQTCEEILLHYYPGTILIQKEE